MSHLLYYWRGDNYRRDLDHGVGFHLNQASPVLHRIELGESLWAFTRRADAVYVIAAELIAKAKTLNQHNFRYGRGGLADERRRYLYRQAFDFSRAAFVVPGAEISLRLAKHELVSD